MTTKQLMTPFLLLFAACSGSVDGDAYGDPIGHPEAGADSAATVVDPTAEPASSKSATAEADVAPMTEIAVLPYGDGDIVFMETTEGGVVAYGRVPAGATPMPQILFQQAPAELYRQLAPGSELPPALVEAERVREMFEEVGQGEPPLDADLTPAGVIELDDLDAEYRAPSGEAFGAFEAWFEENYCGFSEPEVDTCKLARTWGVTMTYTNVNKAAQFLYVEAGAVDWTLRKGSTVIGTNTYNAGYVYGPWGYQYGYIDYLVYIYWKKGTISWQYAPQAGSLYHYSGWATADGGLFIDPPGD